MSLANKIKALQLSMLDKPPDEISLIQAEIELLRRRRQDIIDNPTCLTAKRKSLSSDDDNCDVVERKPKTAPILFEANPINRPGISFASSSPLYFPKSILEALFFVDQLSFESIRQSITHSNYTCGLLPFCHPSVRSLTLPMFLPGTLIPPRLYFSKEEVSPPFAFRQASITTTKKRALEEIELTSDLKRRKVEG
jgi:hypothetical protein